MNLMKQIIWIYHFLITIKFRLKRYFSPDISNRSDFRILLFHEVDQFATNRFETKIDECAKSWTFVDPANLELDKRKPNASTNRDLILTFDDGYSSNFEIAQTVLNPREIKAIFFVIPEFIESSNKYDSEKFIIEQMFPGKRESKIPKHLRSMTWDQILLLSNQGHTIGSHSSSHKRLSELTSKDDLNHQVINSRNVLEKIIGKKIEHFAFPFGNLKSISPIALKIALENYKFVYSGLRGSNRALRSRSVLRRETVYPWDPKGFETAVLAGANDSRFEDSLRVVDDWAKNLGIQSPRC
jgi:peptidoglycan/xylan/chitin deacetylase (PgdA/CDA1 family)